VSCSAVHAAGPAGGAVDDDDVTGGGTEVLVGVEVAGGCEVLDGTRGVDTVGGLDGSDGLETSGALDVVVGAVEDTTGVSTVPDPDVEQAARPAAAIARARAAGSDRSVTSRSGGPSSRAGC
jgi:hypothetical protein